LTELTNSFPLANGPLHFAQTKDLGNELPRRARWLVNICSGNLSISSPFFPL